jgi:hypothetical protein
MLNDFITAIFIPTVPDSNSESRGLNINLTSSKPFLQSLSNVFISNCPYAAPLSNTTSGVFTFTQDDPLITSNFPFVALSLNKANW